MKTIGITVILVASIFLATAFAAPSVGFLAASPGGPLGPCTVVYSSADFSAFAVITISSPGTYCFKPGSYDAQIVVDSGGVTLKPAPGTPPGQVVIQPDQLTALVTDPNSNLPEASIVLVENAVGVTVQNLVVNGSSVTLQSCSPIYVGILFLSSSGEIYGSTVSDVNLHSQSLFGCQSGQGVLVQTSSNALSTVSVAANTVTGYQKNGITCNDQGTTCYITGNTVSPLAAAQPYIASNGIQIAFGAGGVVQGNTVTGNQCGVSVCGPNYVTETQATGVLLFNASPGTMVVGNTVEQNDVGILAYQGSGSVSGNLVLNNRFEGMYLSDGTFTVTGNRLSCGNVGIAVVSDGFTDVPTAVRINGPAQVPPGPPTPPGPPMPPATNQFTVAAIQVVAYTGSPNGGSYAEPVYITVNGLSEIVTAGSSSSPSFVNIMAF
ncbi:MAG: right-handed parallel beta-helix repeat-containing protein [Thermoprotei archaeon]